MPAHCQRAYDQEKTNTDRITNYSILFNAAQQSEVLRADLAIFSTRRSWTARVKLCAEPGAHNSGQFSAGVGRAPRANTFASLSSRGKSRCLFVPATAAPHARNFVGGDRHAGSDPHTSSPWLDRPLRTSSPTLRASQDNRLRPQSLGPRSSTEFRVQSAAASDILSLQTGMIAGDGYFFFSHLLVMKRCYISDCKQQAQRIWSAPA